MGDVERQQQTDAPDGPGYSRRTFIKGVIATGASVSATSYVFRGNTVVRAQAPGAVERLVTLTVNGVPVTVAPDGSFRIRQEVPVGRTDLLLVLEGSYGDRAEHKVLVLPGTICESPGHFRISLTGTPAMIERSLPVFRAANA